MHATIMVYSLTQAKSHKMAASPNAEQEDTECNVASLTVTMQKNDNCQWTAV